MATSTLPVEPVGLGADRVMLPLPPDKAMADAVVLQPVVALPLLSR